MQLGFVGLWDSILKGGGGGKEHLTSNLVREAQA